MITHVRITEAHICFKANFLTIEIYLFFSHKWKWRCANLPETSSAFLLLFFNWSWETLFSCFMICSERVSLTIEEMENTEWILSRVTTIRSTHLLLSSFHSVFWLLLTSLFWYCFRWRRKNIGINGHFVN